MNEADYLLLKWRSLKSWRVSNRKAQEALEEFLKIGVPSSLITHHPTDRQKELLCVVIDECNGTIQEDWDGKMLTKDQAKAYIMHSGKPDPR